MDKILSGFDVYALDFPKCGRDVRGGVLEFLLAPCCRRDKFASTKLLMSHMKNPNNPGDRAAAAGQQERLQLMRQVNLAKGDVPPPYQCPGFYWRSRKRLVRP